MTYMDVAGGGAVFSTGSITFCGSLSHAGYDNNVSRILFNVLNRFGGLGLDWLCIYTLIAYIYAVDVDAVRYRSGL